MTTRATAASWSTNVAAQNQLVGWLSATHPDIVVMHFATNDVWSNKSPQEILAAWTTLVQQMRASKPTMKILVAQIIPVAPSSCADCPQRTVNLNAAIPAWAAGLSTSASPITVVDQWTGWNAATDTSDGVHPNETGIVKLADRWYPALTAALNGTTPTPTDADGHPDADPDADAHPDADRLAVAEPDVHDAARGRLHGHLHGREPVAGRLRRERPGHSRCVALTGWRVAVTPAERRRGQRVELAADDLGHHDDVRGSPVERYVPAAAPPSSASRARGARRGVHGQLLAVTPVLTNQNDVVATVARRRLLVALPASPCVRRAAPGSG